MNGEVNWKAFELKFCNNLQKAFERLAYQLFCREFDISKGLFAYYNQKAIETNPYINEEHNVFVGFQAKYYEGPCINAQKTDELIKEIKSAKECYTGIRCLYFYVNKPFSESPRAGGTKTKSQIKIEKVEKELGIKIQWIVPSNFEILLNKPINKDLLGYYFSSDKQGFIIGDYYENVVMKVEKRPTDSLYGDISLKEGYIEPCIRVNNDEIAVQDYISEWATTNRRNRILIIHGEPGHGKTSMCLKSVYEFYKNNKLADVFDNVFYFSLNPVGTNAANSNPLDIRSLFRWEDENHTSHIFQGNSVFRNALVFLDAYDELLECVHDMDLSELIRCVEDFQKETESHVVITSRTMAIIKDIRDGFINSNNMVPVYELVPVSKERQLKWLDTYKRYCLSEHMTGDWDKYINSIKKNITEEHYSRLMGIPIIFRMIVSNHITIPREDANIVEIYDQLFENTWRRHPRTRGANDRTSVINSLQSLAFLIYLDNTDTAIVKDSFKSPWLFSYYTTSDGSEKVGFYHPSFYQYFLAKEILSWYKKYALNKTYVDADMELMDFENALRYLGRRKLDRTTLDYIEKMYNSDFEKEKLKASFMRALEILKGTDGIIPRFNIAIGTETEKHYEKLDKVNPLERANNVFWNIISIGSICGFVVDTEQINVSSLRLYDMNGCILTGAVLIKEDLSGTKMRGADLRDANLEGSCLIDADLSGAELCGANLKEAILCSADMGSANMKGALFTRADLSEACLSHANLIEAEMSQTNLSDAFINGSDLSGAILRGASLNNAHLRAVDMAGKVNLEHADLRSADLQNSNLHGAILNDADLRSANLKNVALNNAFLLRADLRYANLTGAQLYGAKLKGIKLSGAYLQNIRIDAENLDSLRKSGVNVTSMFTVK